MQARRNSRNIRVQQLLRLRARIFQYVAAVFREAMVRLSKPLPG